MGGAEPARTCPGCSPAAALNKSRTQLPDWSAVDALIEDLLIMLTLTCLAPSPVWERFLVYIEKCAGVYIDAVFLLRICHMYNAYVI